MGRIRLPLPGPDQDQLTGADHQIGKPLPFNRDRAYALYKALFGQIEDLIKGKHLLIVPSGALTQLPFQVLISNSEPGLLLTPPDTATEGDDEYLSASEIAALKLDADWIIQSACKRITSNDRIGRAEAMRRSMLALIDKGETNEAHPAFWAPFVVVGEGAAR